MPLVRLFAAALLAFAPFPGPAHADIHPLVLSGQPAPGTGGGHFEGVGSPSANDAGTIAFRAYLTGTAITEALFVLSEDDLLPIARAGDQVPGLADRHFLDFGSPDINSAGDVVFSARTWGGSRAEHAVLHWSDDALDTIASTGSEIADSDDVFDIVRSPRINDAGKILFEALANPFATVAAIFEAFPDSSGPPRQVGQLESGATGVSMNDTGDFVQASFGGIVITTSGGTSSVAVRGQIVPETDIVLEEMLAPSLNDAGDIVFLNGSYRFVGRGSVLDRHSVIRWRDGALGKVAAAGDAVPGIPDAVFDHFSGAGIDDDGRVLVHARVDPDDANSYDVLFLENGDGVLEPVAGENDAVEGLDAWIDILWPTASRFTGGAALMANLAEGSSAEEGLFRVQLQALRRRYLPQVADGEANGGRWRTEVFLINRSTAAATATVRFHGDSGDPMTVAVEGAESDVFPVDVPALGTASIITDGGGPLEAGWATVEADQDVAAFAVFSFFGGNDAFVDEVGVRSTVGFRSFSIPVDAAAGALTGVALANPNGSPAGATLTLRDAGSADVAETTIEIPAMGHIARYSTELFAEAVPPGFEGRIDVVATRPVIALGLRQRENVFTSLPIVP